MRAFSDIIGGGLLDDTLVLELPGGVAVTCYVDELRHERGLPPNPRAATLLASFGMVEAGILDTLRGDLLVTGVDRRGADVDVPERALALAKSCRLLATVAASPGPRCRPDPSGLTLLAKEVGGVTGSAASYNVHEAKTQLSRILERVERGEEVIISRAGTPVAKVVPLTGTLRRRGRGMLRGRLLLAEDWDSDEVNAAVADDFGATR